MQRLLSLGAVVVLFAGCATQSPTCSDGVRNGEESDVDCGGSSCAPCELMHACLTHEDCQSARCALHLCAGGTCQDGRRNGDESAVDCGGSCGPCGEGAPCAQATDCVSGVCTASVCAAPSCGDQRVNGTETGVDCGGGACAPCALGDGCLRNTDCVSGACRDGACGNGGGGGCAAPLLTCGAQCIDPRFDPLHCGDCATSCAPDARCVGGSCTWSDSPALRRPADRSS